MVELSAKANSILKLFYQRLLLNLLFPSSDRDIIVEKPREKKTASMPMDEEDFISGA